MYVLNPDWVALKCKYLWNKTGFGERGGTLCSLGGGGGGTFSLKPCIPWSLLKRLFISPSVSLTVSSLRWDGTVMGVVSSWALIQWKPAAVDLSCITWRTLIIQDCFVSTVVPVFVCCWVSHLFFSSPSLITEHLSERALLSPAVFRVLALQSFFHNKDLVGVWVYLLVFVAKLVYFPSYPAVVFHLYMWLSPPSLLLFFSLFNKLEKLSSS